MILSFNERQCNEIYDILVEHIGAPERDRRKFVHYHSSVTTKIPSEWCFCGNLGFEGKFKTRRVGFHIGSHTKKGIDKWIKLANKTNTLLKELYNSWKQKSGG